MSAIVACNSDLFDPFAAGECMVSLVYMMSGAHHHVTFKGLM